MLLTYVPQIALTVAKTLPMKRIPVLGEARLPMRCWPHDCDVYLHMNNGRYLTLMDFGRWQHAQLTGLIKPFMRGEVKPIAGGATMSYRREIKMFARYDLVTRIAAWDDKWFYIEHRFEQDGGLNALGFLMGVFKKGKKTVSPGEVIEGLEPGLVSPEPSEELARWIAAQRGWRREGA